MRPSLACTSITLVLTFVCAPAAQTPNLTGVIGLLTLRC